MSWLNGRFEAAHYYMGRLQSSWKNPDRVEELDDFENAMAVALDETGFKGKYVYIQFKGPELKYHSLQVPPMSKKDLALYLKRKVRTENIFADETIFSYTIAPSIKGGELVFLNIITRRFGNGVIEACHRLGLHPIILAPFSSVLASQIKKLSLKTGEITALITEVVGNLVMVLSYGDGKIIFERSFNIGGILRAVREINRSLLFAKQQFGVVIDRIWVIGNMDERLAELGAVELDVPVDQAPAHKENLLWTKETLGIHPSNDSNLIPRNIQKKPIRDLLMKVTVSLVLIVVVISAATIWWIEHVIEKGTRADMMVRPRLVELQKQKTEWEQRHAEIERWKKISATATTLREPPVGGWFLGYLGDELPDGLILTQTSITRDKDGWEIQLEGRSFEGHSVVAEDLRELEDRLFSGPFRIRITKSWREKWLDQLKHGVGTKRDMQMFVIKGHI